MLKMILEKYPEATDFHLTENGPVMIRCKGLLTEGENIDGALLEKEISDRLSPEKREEYKLIGVTDTSLEEGGVRVRVHLYKSGGKTCGALRILPPLNKINPDPDESWIEEVSKLKTGLVLLSGPSGSGKSTTMARILQKIGDTRACHIVTLEDPVEYILQSKTSLIHQREVGEDVPTFAEGVKESLREDPDVIALGEMRDRETMAAALSAAETGHLVLATLHNGEVKDAIGRIIHSFSGDEQSEARNILVRVLRMVSAQRLWQNGKKTVLLREILWNTPAVSHLIRQGREEQMASYMEAGNKNMRTLRQAAYNVRKLTASERKELLEYIER